MPEPERIAIMGCGSGGSYLYRLLRQQNPHLQLKLFDKPTSNPCGIKGCAWGLSRLYFEQLCETVGFEPARYIIDEYDHVVVNGQNLKADLVIINKPVFVKDLIGEVSIAAPAELTEAAFDRIIDATGHERACLPPVDASPLVSAVQVRLKAKPPDVPTAVFNPRGGYSWLFPVGPDEVHLGSLSPIGFDVAREELKKMMGSIGQDRVICSCRGKIRCHGPAKPFIDGKTWGLGESIGLVDPVTGAGIVPAMISAQMMLENWDSPSGYERTILHRFSYMSKEADVLNRLAAGRPLSSTDLFFPKQALETIGLKPGLIELLRLVVQGARDYLSTRK